MDQPFDTQAAVVRAGELASQVRKSEMYPALIGGIAGGVAGALMAAIIAGRVSSPRPTVHVSTAAGKETQGKGWTAREIIQLATVVATLFRQIQAFAREQKHQGV